MRYWIVTYLSRRCTKVVAATVEQALSAAQAQTGEANSNVISVVRL